MVYQGLPILYMYYKRVRLHLIWMLAFEKLIFDNSFSSYDFFYLHNIWHQKIPMFYRVPEEFIT